MSADALVLAGGEEGAPNCAAIVEFAATAQQAAARSDPAMASAYARLRGWIEQAVRAHAANTLLAWESDWSQFVAFCQTRHYRPMPASTEVVSEFIKDCVVLGYACSSIRRFASTIATLHRAAELDNPCGAPGPRLEMKAAFKELGARQKQARGLVWDEIEHYLTIAPATLRDRRDRALVVVAYDTLCRCEEIVRLDVAHFDTQGGSHSVLITESKSDQKAEGQRVYLSPLGAQLLQEWKAAARIRSGAVFVRVIGQQKLGERLSPPAVAEVFRRIGLHIGLARSECQRLSGHSTRVGATQDMLALNIDPGSVALAGRWEDARMVLRYGEHQLAQRGGMARAARLQGRDGARVDPEGSS